MARRNKRKHNNVEEVISPEFNTNIKSILITIVCVLLVLGLFYLLTLRMTAKGEKKEIMPASIGYEKITVGSVFDIDEKSYLVVLYDREDDSEITNAINTYNSKHKNDVYYVDLADGLNKKSVSNEPKTNVTKASELKVKNPTMLKITNKKIEEVFDSKDSITKYLMK